MAIKSIFTHIFYTFAAFALVACGHNHDDHDDHDHDHDHDAGKPTEAHEEHDANTVEFHEEMQAKIDFSVEEVTLRDLGNVIHTVGQVQPSQGDVRTVTARSEGVVTFADGNLTAGAQVKAGQTLFRIDGSATADNNLALRLREAKNNLDHARGEWERMQSLHADGLCTQREYTAARLGYENAKAQYDTLSQGFAGGASSASSPIGGYVTSLLVTNGQHVEAGTPLATVSQNRDLFITAEVAPSHYRDLARITGANFTFPSTGETLSLEQLGGKVMSYGRSVDASNPLIPVTFRINNAVDLLPGSFVDMYITTSGEEPLPAVPSCGIVEEMGNHFVFVQLSPESFEKRQITPGGSDGLYTAVTRGVSPGEKVVGRGAVMVKLSQASGQLDAHSGHVH